MQAEPADDKDLLLRRIDEVLRDADLTAASRIFLEQIKLEVQRADGLPRLFRDDERRLVELLGKDVVVRQSGGIYRWFRSDRSLRRVIRDVAILAALLVLVLGFHSLNGGFLAPKDTNASPQTITRDRFTVIDGDTIRLDTEPADTRLVGFNAPEVIKPNCEAEVPLGERARNRLTDLLGAGRLDFMKVPCNCKPGTEGTAACNKGRSCGTLKVDGVDVGEILIGEGLAARFVCSDDGCPKTPRPWCDP